MIVKSKVLQISKPPDPAEAAAAEGIRRRDLVDELGAIDVARAEAIKKEIDAAESLAAIRPTDPACLPSAASRPGRGRPA